MSTEDVNVEVTCSSTYDLNNFLNKTKDERGGMPKLDPFGSQLYQEILKLSRELPETKEQLLKRASDPQYLVAWIETLLVKYGSKLWSKNADQTQSLSPRSASDAISFQYPKDRETIKQILRQWVILTRNSWIRNKSKTASGIDYQLITQNKIHEKAKKHMKKEAEQGSGSCKCSEAENCQAISCNNVRGLIECDSRNCKLEFCNNRRFIEFDSRRSGQSTVKIFRTQDDRGDGLQAGKEFKAQELVAIYTGEVITEQVKKSRNDAYVMYLSSELWIDAGRYGGHARFINHSCEPNCVVERWIVGDELRLGVFAKRQILVGKELTIDYNYRFNFVCKCGVETCKDAITRPHTTPPTDTNIASNDLEGAKRKCESLEYPQEGHTDTLQKRPCHKYSKQNDNGCPQVIPTGTVTQPILSDGSRIVPVVVTEMEKDAPWVEPREKSGQHAHASKSMRIDRSYNAQNPIKVVLETATCSGYLNFQVPSQTSQSSYMNPSSSSKTQISRSSPAQPASKASLKSLQGDHPLVLKSQPITVTDTDSKLATGEATAMLLTLIFFTQQAAQNAPRLVKTFWDQRKAQFTADLDGAYNLTDKVLTTWLDVQHTFVKFQGELSEGRICVQLARNDFVASHWKWKAMRHIDDLKPKDTLVDAFRLITGQDYDFREGLARLEDQQDNLVEKMTFEVVNRTEM